jgi:hypothetical protein
MTALDQQLMTKTESVYGTPVTPDLTFEFNSEGIEESYGRTEGDPLRNATFVKRNDRFTPYFSGAAGPVEMDVMTKGFGFWLKHMLGQVATTGPTETTVYTHTATMADLFGKSYTLQVARPFHPSGTVQPFTYEGGKVTEWELANSVDGNLVATLGTDFQQVLTATALATAAYPASMENLTWAGGVVTIGGTQVPITEISVKGNNGLNVDRRFINGTTDKAEPTGGRREVSFSLSCDFDTLTQRNRAAGTTRAAALAAIVATWTGPTLLGSTIYPSLQVSIPAARFDEWKAANEGPEGITQELSGVGLFDGTNSAVSIVYKSADTSVA